MGELIRLFPVREAKRRRTLTERQRYEAEVWRQRLRNDPTISDADKELAQMIGPPGMSDYWPPDDAA